MFWNQHIKGGYMENIVPALFRMEIHPVITNMGNTREDSYLLLQRSTTIPGIFDEIRCLNSASASAFEPRIVDLLPDEYTTLRVIVTDNLMEEAGFHKKPLDNIVHEGIKNIGYTTATHRSIAYGEVSGDRDINRMLYLAIRKIIKETFGYEIYAPSLSYDLSSRPANNQGIYSVAIYTLVSIHNFLDCKKEAEKKAIEMGYEWVTAKQVIMSDVLIDGATSNGHNCITMLLRRALD